MRGRPPLPDVVDRVIADWAEQAPDLPVAPIGVLTRVGRLRTRFDEELAGVFARFDLTAADFSVIASLRRAGAPHRLAQSVLMGRLGLTSGTISVRLTRLEAKGVVTRSPSPDDARGTLVTLTARGLALFDEVAPVHLANEDVLLSALTAEERDQLAGLLRRLLVGFEHEHSAGPLGMSLAAAHVTRRARTAVGLSDRAGLLVEQVAAGSPAEAAGLQEGDVLVGLDGRPLRSCVDLAAAQPPLELRVLRGETERDVHLPAPDGGGSGLP